MHNEMINPAPEREIGDDGKIRDGRENQGKSARSSPDSSSASPLTDGLDVRQPRNGSDHQAGEQLHSSHVAVIEGVRSAGENFEYAQCSAEMSQRRHQNGARAESAATGKIDKRIALGVVAKHDFAGADAIG